MTSPYHEGFFGVFQAQPRIDTPEWAEQNRVLTSLASDESGPWRNERTPYLVEIMRELSASSRTKEVVFCKGSQVGATEVGVNWILYLIDCLPGPIMVVQPDDSDAEDVSKTRIAPGIERCERVRKKVSESKSRSSSNTIFTKEFVGGTLFIRGASTSKNLSGKPVGNLHLDELDRYPKSLPNEGDPVKVALRRITNFPRAKVFYSSTPTTIEDSRIWKLYLDSDRRIYEVPCPECGHRQQIVFERIRWDKGDYVNVYLVCEKCEFLIPEYHKTTMLAKGKWRATNSGHWRAGFHLSALYSPLGWFSWGDAARLYDEAEGDEDALISFVQTVLGLPYESKSESLAEGFLARRVEKYDTEVPDGVLMLTMAVDVQRDRLEYEVVGWGEDEESWGIRYGIIRGDPTELKSGDPEKPSVWEVLDRCFEKRFQHADGGDIGVSCMVVDSGAFTDTVYRYTRAKEDKREWVFSVKGGNLIDAPLMSKPSRKGRDKALLFVLGVEQGKTLIHNRLRKDKPGPGYCHFPRDENTGYDKHVYAGLTGEHRVERRDRRTGKAIKKWEKIRGRDNEPFDIRVYNTAAIRIRKPNWNELREMRQAMKGRPVVKGQPEKVRSKRARRSGNAAGGIKLVTV